jgi:hypothetical protein
MRHWPRWRKPIGRAVVGQFKLFPTTESVSLRRSITPATS